jgi:NAD-dependent deacetylase
MFADDTQQLAKWIASSTSAVAFTGAGISTESGIPDFRGPAGLWSRFAPVPYDQFVASREARARYWRIRLEMYREFAAAEPNAGHRALADLENAGRLVGVITQNIDGLHQLAGSHNVIELHGTARRVACIACAKSWPPDIVHARIEAGDEAPDCDECGAPLKSATISFGQMLPHEELHRAAQWAREADLFMAIGSSLVVEPAASIPRLAKNRNARLVIVNGTETPLDYAADLIIRQPIGRTLSAVMERICGAQSPRKE